MKVPFPNHAVQVIEPAGGEVARFHDAKYRVFHRMYSDQIAYRQLMTDEGESE